MKYEGVRQRGKMGQEKEDKGDLWRLKAVSGQLRVSSMKGEGWRM